MEKTVPVQTTIGVVCMNEEDRQEDVRLLLRRIHQWAEQMERLQLAEYVRYVHDRKKLFWRHFWSGVARGIGAAVGFTVLGAILVLILQDLARRNLPLIGDALAQIVSVVQRQLE